jgi:cell wall-associated NlpC family hydrolase
MAKKIILCLVLALALALSPETVSAVPTKQVKKKSTSLKAKKSPTKSTKTTKSSRKSKSKKRTRAHSSSKKKKKSRSYRRRVTRNYSEEDTPVSRPYRAGIADTKPLMRVIPQRDGRFLLEPLTPKKKVEPLARPTSKLDSKRTIAPGGRGYNLYEPWNFRELVLSSAKCYRGARYSRGASLQTSNATDCSGFVQFIYQGFQINLPRSSREQAQVGKVVTHDMDFSKLVPGDLLFFRRGGYSIGHAGIYLGEGKMIHASNYRNGVIVTDLRQGYYQNTFVVAKRVFEVKFPK